MEELGASLSRFHDSHNLITRRKAPSLSRWKSRLSIFTVFSVVLLFLLHLLCFHLLQKNLVML